MTKPVYSLDIKKITKIWINTGRTLWCLYKRTIIEIAVTVFHFGLTCKQSKEVERIQKIAFKTILQEYFTSYTKAFELLSTLSLKKRCNKLWLRFAKKNFKRNFNMFDRSQTKIHNTRNPKKPALEPRCNINRYPF